MRNVGWRAPLFLALLFLAVMCAGLAIQPPAVREGADTAAFDTPGAIARLERVLGEDGPHPTDSAAQDRVLERLLREIRALGLTPDVTDTFACRSQPRLPIVDCARVRNVTFAIGPENAPSILATAHHDSVPAATGAADDGLGLAVWLETARVLASEPLQRRVLFVFTDGEEPALLGADVFAKTDPRMQNAQAIVNLEARGTRGPAAFFETNSPNADAIAAYARGARRPLANSIMAGVYELLPNDTDVSVLRRDGLDIINIGILDGVVNYHTPRDTLDNLDPRSVQHMGDQAVGIVRALASAQDRGRSGDVVFTDVLTLGMISAPELAARVALALAGLIALGLFVTRRGSAWWRAFLAPILAVVVAGALAYGVHAALGALRGGEPYWYAYPEASRAWCALVAVFAVVLSLWLLARREGAERLGDAAFFWFALLGSALAFVLPGALILFAPPALLYAIGAVAERFWRPARAIGVISAALATLILWAPTLYLTEVAMGFDYAFGTAALVALMLTPWMSTLVVLHDVRAWRLQMLGAGAIAVLAIVVAALAPTYTPEKPRAFNLSAFADLDEGVARVFAGNAQRALPPSIAAAASFEPQPVIPGDELLSWGAPIDLPEQEGARLVLLADEATAGGRTLRARLDMHGAYRAMIRIPRAAAPGAASMRGFPVDFDAAFGEGEWVALACSGRACDGAEIEVTLGNTDADLGWYVIGLTPGVNPAIAEVSAARPDWTIPIQNGDVTLTLRRAAYATPGTP